MFPKARDWLGATGGNEVKTAIDRMKESADRAVELAQHTSAMLRLWGEQLRIAIAAIEKREAENERLRAELAAERARCAAVRTEPPTHLWPGEPTETDRAIWRTAQLSMGDAIEKGGPGVCYVCGSPATCRGSADIETVRKFACDDHCGHSNEDGRCVPIEKGGP